DRRPQGAGGRRLRQHPRHSRRGGEDRHQTDPGVRVGGGHPRHRAEVSAPKVKRLLEEYRDQAVLSKRMATILRNVDVTLDLTHGSAKDYRPEAARTILADLGFRSLAARVPTTWTDGSAMSAPPIFAPLLSTAGAPAEPPAD